MPMPLVRMHVNSKGEAHIRSNNGKQESQGGGHCVGPVWPRHTMGNCKEDCILQEQGRAKQQERKPREGEEVGVDAQALGQQDSQKGDRKTVEAADGPQSTKGFVEKIAPGGGGGQGGKGIQESGGERHGEGKKDMPIAHGTHTDVGRSISRSD